MDALVAFANGLLHFVLQAVSLVVNFFIYILSFIISLLQQLLNSFV